MFYNSFLVSQRFARGKKRRWILYLVGINVSDFSHWLGQIIVVSVCCYTVAAFDLGCVATVSADERPAGVSS